MPAQTAFDTITVTPSADVATNGTVTFTYPAGRAKAEYAQAGEVLVANGLQSVLAVGAGAFSLSYGASSATLTYLGSTSLPAGKSLTLQLPLATYEDLGASLTDSTTGTAAATLVDCTGTYTQAKVNANFASLAAHQAAIETKVNNMLAAMRAFGTIPS